MKKAFTLVELLVVMGILGILVTVSLVALSGTSQSALNVKCETNMRNLAAACQTYGMSSGYYPLAGSVEVMSMDTSQGAGNYQTVYAEKPGWISWNSQNAYVSKPTSSAAGTDWWLSAYDQDVEAMRYCLTNGVLWKHVSGNREVYRCPLHVDKFRKTPPTWSYVMNGAFGWDTSEGARARLSSYNGVQYGTLSRADRRLLFAELPFMGVEVEANVSESAGLANDCTLQYTKNEVIGFNHSSGKREKFALVVFADAHTERISWPRGGLSSANLKDLTEWLCTGKDVSFNGKVYEELD